MEVSLQSHPRMVFQQSNRGRTFERSPDWFYVGALSDSLSLMSCRVDMSQIPDEIRPITLKPLCANVLDDALTGFKNKPGCAFVCNPNILKWGIDVETAGVRPKICFLYVLASAPERPIKPPHTAVLQVIPAPGAQEVDVNMEECPGGRRLSRRIALRLPIAKLSSELSPALEEKGFLFNWQTQVFSQSDVLIGFRDIFEEFEGIDDDDADQGIALTAGAAPSPTKRSRRKPVNPESRRLKDMEDAIIKLEKAFDLKKHVSNTRALTECSEFLASQVDHLYPWGNSAVDDSAGRRIKVPLQNFHKAPDTWVYRSIVPKRVDELKAQFIGNRSTVQRLPIIVIPVQPVQGAEPGKFEVVPTIPTDRDAMATHHFWIVGGQHTIMASEAVIRENASDPTFQDQYGKHEIIVVWTLDMNHIRLLSRILNSRAWDKESTPDLFDKIKQARAVWKEMGSPSAVEVRSVEWIVSTLPSLYCSQTCFCEFLHWETSP